MLLIDAEHGRQQSGQLRNGLGGNNREQPPSVDTFSERWLPLLYREGGENRIGQQCPQDRGQEP